MKGLRLSLGLSPKGGASGEPPEPSAPSAFSAGQWAIEDTMAGETLSVTISSLPSNGGSAITSIEYRIDGGTWTSSGLTSTGTFEITGLTNTVEYDVELRANNAIGNGAASDVKSATPTTSAFAPTDIPDLVLYVDFADEDTLFADTAGTTPATTTILRANDKSGQGNHLTISSGGPTKRTAPNGKNVADFSGTQRLNFPSALYTLTTANHTVLVSMKSDTPTKTTQRVIAGMNSSNQTRYKLGPSGSGTQISAQNNSTDLTYSVTVDSNVHILGTVRNGSAASTSFAILYDGDDVAYGTAANQTIDKLSLGARPDNGQDGLDGYIDKVLIYSRVLSNDEANSVGEWMATEAGGTWAGTLSAPSVTGLWTGEADTSSVSITGSFSKTVTDARIAISTSSDLSSPTYYNFPSGDSMARHRIEGLSEDTQYYYAFELEGTLNDSIKGAFKTTSLDAYSFRFSFASCCENPTSRAVWQQVIDSAPLFFQHMGDLHYDDLNSTNPRVYFDAMKRQIDHQYYGPIFRQFPVLYMYSDHDFCGSNTYGNASGRNAVIENYRNFVPVHSLAESDITDSVQYVRQIGRVVFIQLDARANSSPASDTDNFSKTRLGATQKQWLKDQLLANSTGKLIVLFTEVPWISSSDTDTWFGYSTERAELADYMKTLGLEGRVIIVAGDAHMLAFDSGANADYATSGGMDIPVFQAAPLSRSASPKGGPYSGGTYTSSTGGNFGIIDITDTGGSTIDVDFQGINETDGVVKSHSLTVTL